MALSTQGLQRAALARCGRVQLLPPHRKQAKFLACCCQLCPGFQVKPSPARGAESGLTGSLGLSHHQHPPRGRDSRSCYLGKESQSHQNAPSSEPPTSPNVALSEPLFHSRDAAKSRSPGLGNWGPLITRTLPRSVCQTRRQLTASSGCPRPLTERVPALSPGRTTERFFSFPRKARSDPQAPESGWTPPQQTPRL